MGSETYYERLSARVVHAHFQEGREFVRRFLIEWDTRKLLYEDMSKIQPPDPPPGCDWQSIREEYDAEKN